MFEEDLEALEAEHAMPYLTSIERRALERGESQGFQRGESQGFQRGESQGRMQLLRTQLEHRFGKLPEWTSERLGKASPGQLDGWAVRLLDATRVEDVFR